MNKLDVGCVYVKPFQYSNEIKGPRGEGAVADVVEEGRHVKYSK